MCWSLSFVGLLLACICTQTHGFTAFMPCLTHRAGQMIRKGCCQTNQECQALSRPLPQRLSRTCQAMSSGQQAVARLVEVQREILETGLSDTGKIGQYALMLRNAKKVLMESLVNSGGLMTAEGAEIVEDLHEVAPLQNPTKETNLLSGCYDCVSCELPGSKWNDTILISRIISELEFMDVEKEISGLEVTILGATYELHDDLLVRTIRMKEEDGKVMELKIEGKLESLGPTKFSVEFSFGRRCSQVLYLDQELLILREEGKKSEEGKEAHVVILRKKM